MSEPPFTVSATVLALLVNASPLATSSRRGSADHILFLLVSRIQKLFDDGSIFSSTNPDDAAFWENDSALSE